MSHNRLSAVPYQFENLSKEKLALEITTLNEKLAQEANLYEEKGKEFEKIKLQSEEEKIKLERNQQNENKMTHDLLAERDRTHELQIDLASLELQIKHAVQVGDRQNIWAVNNP